MKRLTNTYFFSTSFCTNFAPKNNKSILFKYAVRHISPFEGGWGDVKKLSVDKISLFVEFICANPPHQFTFAEKFLPLYYPLKLISNNKVL